MRKKLREVTDKAAIEKFLSTCRIGRLATLGQDGYPYITPLNYVYVDDTIYFHCALKGEKLDNIARDNRVCFEIDVPVAYLDTGYDPTMAACDIGQLYQSVVVRGRAVVVDDMQEKLIVLNALTRVHEADIRVPDFPEITAETKAVKLCAVIAIRIESLSCKANLFQHKSEEEKAALRSHLVARNLPGDAEALKFIE